ncbi:MAG: histidine phosphatase family protein [Lentisphaerae bacterium]|nr:histidine phosphatase family protein [Lentisphaerota bacterium]MBT4818789.1 histidine phosphatase family protein [Lentisphaerota bacterium]MBT5608398.1 histidine phosphatase family protein [Lentisphaerota bacterium]MBT7054982.1 histidine phosphatase family protein [Lentisphaerota bacterium]MBT7844821.1 histidine phosphatase family protein [Lentisphaerota bacterium]
MKQIWLVRHGESMAQTGEEEDGRNPPLSERGKEQAARLRHPLGAVTFDRILVSPLIRACQTYELSEVDRTNAEFDSRVMESEWGNPEFYTPVLPLQLPETAAPDRHNAYDLTVEERAASVIEELADGNTECCLIVAHWGICGRLFMAFAGATVTDWSVLPSMDNTGISLFEIDDEGRRWVRYWNDRGHVLDLLD